MVEYDDSNNPIGLVPGLIIADSNGSACSGSSGVINVSGAGSIIRSDGPAGCGNGATYTYRGYAAEEGCGRIQLVAPRSSRLQHTGVQCQRWRQRAQSPPAPLTRWYTRQPADHRFNSYFDYADSPLDTRWAADPLTTSNQQNIGPCNEWDGTGGGNDYIYNLISEVGQAPNVPAGFELWSADPTRGCTVSGNITVNANVVVDCPTLRVNGGNSLTINGKVVFNKDVTVQGSLTINPPAGDGAWVLFRGGRLSKAGSGTLAFNGAMVYMAKSSDIKLTGGSGALTWTAPTTGNFADLALWSDSQPPKIGRGRRGSI